MEKHTKDEINFGGFLATYRMMQGVQMVDLTRGLYSKSMMSRVESGERLPKKLERDRLVARLGVSGEDYEDYLSREEYADWVMRQEILASIDKKDVAALEELLKAYEAIEDLDRVELQFLETMRYMMLTIQGAPREELCKTIELAVSYTIEDVETGFPEGLILADQEINLLIEYVSLHQYGANAKECRDWRFDRYNDIRDYIDNSYIDNIGKAKIYPKLVYYICKEYMNEESSIEELEYCLKICTDAIELLRDRRSSYYWLELLETRQWFMERLFVGKAVDGEITELMEENRLWIEVFLELSEEYGISPYMDNFVYLYWETESHNVNHVIKVRRKMFKITQKQLAGDDFGIKTVARTEQGKLSPQIYTVRGLFGKLGLCPEYVRGNVITHDPEVLKLHLDVMRYANERMFDEWEKGLAELESRLCMDIVQNRQAVEHSRVILESLTKKITPEETVERLIEVLELTVPIKNCFKLKAWYFTLAEVNLLYNIAGRYKAKQKNVYEELLVKYLEQELYRDEIVSRPDMYEMVLTCLANDMGDRGEYEASTNLSEKVVKTCLKMRRMRTLPRNLYIKCWNQYNIDGTSRLKTNKPQVRKCLKRCISLSKIIRHKKLEEFFAAKLDN